MPKGVYDRTMAKPRPRRTSESREKMRAITRAKWTDPGYRDRVHAALPRGERNPSWRGDAVGYAAVHTRHQRSLQGQPCASADETCSGPFACALRRDTPAEHLLGSTAEASRGLLFSLHAEDYQVLCTHHHRQYDWDQEKNAALHRGKTHA